MTPFRLEINNLNISMNVLSYTEEEIDNYFSGWFEVDNLSSNALSSHVSGSTNLFYTGVYDVTLFYNN